MRMIANAPPSNEPRYRCMVNSSQSSESLLRLEAQDLDIDRIADPTNRPPVMQKAARAVVEAGHKICRIARRCTKQGWIPGEIHFFANHLEQPIHRVVLSALDLHNLPIALEFAN